MIRGLFTNKTVRNLIGEDIPPGSTIHAGTGEVLSLWEAAKRYKAEGRSTVIVAGERYGMGSSRDWAAKGVALLGVRAVLTSSFERIHRWNLIGMGVLPLRLPTGTMPETLGLSADATIIEADPSSISPRAAIAIGIRYADGSLVSLDATAAIKTHAEVEILRAGGVLPLILKRLMKRRLST